MKIRANPWLRSPPDADRDRPQVGADVVVLAVEIAEFDVQIHVRTNLAGDASAEVVPELVLAGVKKIPVDRKAAVEAVSPPDEE